MCLVPGVWPGVVTAQLSELEFDRAAADDFIAEYRRSYAVPGVAIVITDGSEIVYARGYGHDSIGRPISSATRLPIASLSKSFTALAVILLVEDGKLKLDDPVRNYLTEFDLADARSDEITIRQLLDHTSGMSDMTFPEKSIPTPQSLAAAIGMLRSAELSANPGTRRQYHNPNYWIAARLVEVVSGKEFGAYLAEEIFAPLGMTNTSTVVSLRAAPDVPPGYVRFFGRPVALNEPQWFLGGCCGVVTTAEDMGRWLAFHNSMGETATGERLISIASMNELHDGLGWNAREQDGRSIFTHNGILFTFSARQYLLPDVADGVGIAVVTTTGIALAPVDSDSIANALLQMVEGRSAEIAGPTGLTIDLVLFSLSVVTTLIGVVAVWRSRRWAHVRSSRSLWRNALVQLPCVIPVVLLVSYPTIVGIVAGGRDVNWIQSLYLSTLLFAFVVIWALTSTAVVTSRTIHWRRVQRASRIRL